MDLQTIGAWLGIIGFPFIFLGLLFGRRIEEAFSKWWGATTDNRAVARLSKIVKEAVDIVELAKTPIDFIGMMAKHFYHFATSALLLTVLLIALVVYILATLKGVPEEFQKQFDYGFWVIIVFSAVTSLEIVIRIWRMARLTQSLTSTARAARIAAITREISLLSAKYPHLKSRFSEAGRKIFPVDKSAPPPQTPTNPPLSK